MVTRNVSPLKPRTWDDPLHVEDGPPPPHIKDDPHAGIEDDPPLASRTIPPRIEGDPLPALRTIHPTSRTIPPGIDRTRCRGNRPGRGGIVLDAQEGVVLHVGSEIVLDAG